MFDLKKFEEKIYVLVTREFNKVSKVLIDHEAETQVNGVQFFKEVISALHSVTEEIAVQTLYGLMTLAEVRHRKAKSVPFFRMKTPGEPQSNKEES